MSRKQPTKQTQTGSTIIEVLIATVVVAMVLTAVAAMMTVSVKSTAQQKYRSVATSQAQNALEVFRRERNVLGWDTFYASLGSGTYCLNTLPATSQAFDTLTSGECGDTVQLLGSDFTREAVIVKTATEVRVDILLNWLDGTEVRDVTLTQIFKEY